MGNGQSAVCFSDEGMCMFPLLQTFATKNNPKILNCVVASNRGHLLTFTSAAVNLNHFRLLRVVGKGAFGKVRIVERKDTGLTFALKYASPMSPSWESADMIS